MTEREQVAGETPDLKQELLARLKEVAPEAFADGKFNFEKLHELLGPVEDKLERFSFTWAGKRDAVAMLQVPTRATLTPDYANSINFEEARHVFIEGENLETLKVPYRSYFGRVKMIYLDPPFNTGNDFIYPDNFADPLDHYLKITGQKGGNGDYLTTLTEQSGRIHSAWLSMMYPRLVLARQLLREDGLLFISIDDHELPALRLLLNEVFGEENFVAQFIWKSRLSEDTRAKTGVSTDHEYILCYRRSDDGALRGTEKDLEKFSNPDDDPRGPWRSADLTGLATKDQRPNLHYDLIDPETKINYGCPPKGWRFDQKAMTRKIEEERILWPSKPEGRPRHKLFLNEMKNLFKNISSVITDITTAEGTRETNRLVGDGLFPFPKPSALLARFVEQATEEDDIVLDFFAGSAPLAQAVLAVNAQNGGRRRSILVQLPEPTEPRSVAREKGFDTIADIGRARIRAYIKEVTLPPPNDAFRAFRLTDSNIRRWAGVETKDADAYAEQLDAFTDTLVDGWKPDNVIWEVALREGYPLTSQIEKRDVDGQTIWRVTDPERQQRFHICLDDTLSVDAVQTLGLTREDLFVCRDKALDDTLAANLALQCRLKVL